LNGASAHTALILEAIERDHLRLNPRPFDEQLTRQIVGALDPLFRDDVSTFLTSYSEFVATNEAKLRYVFSAYNDDFRHILMTQPEALLLFYWVDARMVPEVEERWPEILSRDELESFQSLWST
jgi:hypothetical protein